MYHWRVLPGFPPEGPDSEPGGIDEAVARWEGSPAVRRRLEAVSRSSSSLVLFLEHVPQTLAARLTDRREAAGHDGDDAPCPWIEEALARGAAFMSSHGLVHFDSHFRNVLTDGRLVYFADFGLALSSSFDLSPDESRFLTDHLAYDRCYIASHLLRYHLPDGTRDQAAHEAFLHDWITGNKPGHVPPHVAVVIERNDEACLPSSPGR
jgi:hypothetical protein